MPLPSRRHGRENDLFPRRPRGPGRSRSADHRSSPSCRSGPVRRSRSAALHGAGRRRPSRIAHRTGRDAAVVRRRQRRAHRPRRGGAPADRAAPLRHRGLRVPLREPADDRPGPAGRPASGAPAAAVDGGDHDLQRGRLCQRGLRCRSRARRIPDQAPHRPGAARAHRAGAGAQGGAGSDHRARRAGRVRRSRGTVPAPLRRTRTALAECGPCRCRAVAAARRRAGCAAAVPADPVDAGAAVGSPGLCPFGAAGWRRAAGAADAAGPAAGPAGLRRRLRRAGPCAARPGRPGAGPAGGCARPAR